jgi:hypothetical protein
MKFDVQLMFYYVSPTREVRFFTNMVISVTVAAIISIHNGINITSQGNVAMLQNLNTININCNNSYKPKIDLTLLHPSKSTNPFFYIFIMLTFYALYYKKRCDKSENITKLKT